ncbi:hypothetical protein BC826DRAFT_1045463 [Russula brevipes]|nr:hypothetical protein BC826DRAFT_1045463 [Russula brevipes]
MCCMSSALYMALLSSSLGNMSSFSPCFLLTVSPPLPRSFHRFTSRIPNSFTIINHGHGQFAVNRRLCVRMLRTVYDHRVRFRWH